MKISTTEAYAKLEKLANNQQTFQFALSPKGSLLINHVKSFEILDFMLYWNGNYFKRDLLEVTANFELSENGAFLCSYGKHKFVAARPDGSYEYATAKKQLAEDFSLVMYIRFDERIVLLVADGKFAKEASLVTLSDARRGPTGAPTSRGRRARAPRRPPRRSSSGRAARTPTRRRTRRSRRARDRVSTGRCRRA